MHSVMRKIEVCGERVIVWNKEVFGNVKKGLEKARANLQSIQRSDPRGNRRHEHKAAISEVQNWLEREEIMWRKRSKALWLKEGILMHGFFIIKSHRGKRRIL